MAGRGQRNELNGLALISGGFVLVASSVAGWYLGGYLGRVLGHDPVPGAIIGFILGTIIGFWDFFRIALQIMKRQPTPSAAQQRAAKENWEKSENSEELEGDRE